MIPNRYFVTSQRNGGLYLETTDLQRLLLEIEEDVNFCFERVFDNIEMNFVDNHLSSDLMEKMVDFTENNFNNRMKLLKNKVKQLEKLSEKK